METPLRQDAASATLATGAGLGSIVYISRAARQVTLDDLNHLLTHARARNEQEGITGVLLYAEGSFLQYLEGPADGLMRVYAIIKRHPLHFGLIDLVREPISARAFAEWSMACHWVGASGGSPLTDHYELLASRMAAAVSQKSTASDLLSKFWAVGRHAVAPVLSDHSAARLRRWQAAPIDDSAAE